MTDSDGMIHFLHHINGFLYVSLQQRNCHLLTTCQSELANMGAYDLSVYLSVLRVYARPPKVSMGLYRWLFQEYDFGYDFRNQCTVLALKLVLKRLTTLYAL